MAESALCGQFRNGRYRPASATAAEARPAAKSAGRRSPSKRRFQAAGSPRPR